MKNITPQKISGATMQRPEKRLNIKKNHKQEKKEIKSL